MNPKLSTETCVKMIVRIYDFPGADGPGPRPTMSPGEVERIIEVNGTPVYAMRTSLALDEDTMPRQFEKWLIELTQSMEIPDCRHNSRTNRRNFLQHIQAIWYEVFRKFIQ